MEGKAGSRALTAWRAIGRSGEGAAHRPPYPAQVLGFPVAPFSHELFRAAGQPNPAPSKPRCPLGPLRPIPGPSTHSPISMAQQMALPQVPVPMPAAGVLPPPPQALLLPPASWQVSLDWTEEEQRALEAAMQRYPADRVSVVERYVRITAMLPRKSVRDVALRTRWTLQQQMMKKRSLDHLPLPGGPFAKPGVPGAPLPPRSAAVSRCSMLAANSGLSRSPAVARWLCICNIHKHARAQLRCIFSCRAQRRRAAQARQRSRRQGPLLRGLRASCWRPTLRF